MEKPTAMLTTLLLGLLVAASGALALQSQQSHGSLEAFKGAASESRWPGHSTAFHGGRHLLQGCSANVAGASLSYTACQTVASLPNFSFLWTLGTSGSNTILNASFSASTTGWAAWGISPDGGMLGSTAIIAKTDASSPTGATAASYYLGDYSASAIVPGGNFTVLSAVASASGGVLSAAFSIVLPASTTPSAVRYISAIGLLSSSGVLQQHSDSQGVPGTINLLAGQSAASAPVSAATPASAAGALAAPAPSAAAVASSPSAAASASGATSASAAATGSSALSASSAFTFPVGNPISSNGANSACGSVAVYGQTYSFQQCVDLSSSLDVAYRLYWTLSNYASNSSAGNNIVMNAALVSGVTSGWAGFGIPSTPGQMVGSSAVVVASCSSSSTSCPTGATVNTYLLSGLTSSLVLPGQGRLQLLTAAASASSTGLSAIMSLALDASYASTSTPLPIVYAHGTLSSSGSLQAHDSSQGVAGTVALASGTSTVAGNTKATKRKAHAIIMCVTFGAVVPFAILMARLLRTTRKRFFLYLHSFAQVLTAAAVIAGLVLGVMLGEPTGRKLERAHRGLGVSVVALVLAIAMTAFIRPDRAAKRRSLWAVPHRWLGRLALAGAIVNVNFGFVLTHQKTLYYYLFHIGIVVVAVIVLLLALMALLKPRRGEPSGAISSSKQGYQGYQDPPRRMAEESRPLANGRGSQVV